MMILSVMMGLLQGAEQNSIAVFIIQLLVFVKAGFFLAILVRVFS